MRGLALLSLSLLFGPGLQAGRAPVPAKPVALPPETPTVTVLGGAPPRISARCAKGSHVEVDGAISPFGARPFGERMFGTLSRADATVTCIDDKTALKSTHRMIDAQLRAVTPLAVRDASATRVVLTLDGTALGPLDNRDDGVYLVWPFGLVRLKTPCPETHADNGRVVVCATQAQVAGRGPARVRLQTAGRLVESPTPLDFDKALAPK